MTQTFKITNEIFIERLDSKNWIISKKSIAEKGNNIGEEVSRTIGYYGKLEHAWKSLIDYVALNNIKNKDLLESLKLLKELKEPFSVFLKQNSK